METATKMSHSGRSADRLLEALATVAALLDRSMNEVKALDGEFQERLLQAVHDTEVSIESQTTEHMERAVSEARDKLRQELSEGFKSQLAEMRSEFEIETDRLNRELSRVSMAAAQLEADRQRLTAEIESMQVQVRSAQEKSREAKANTTTSSQPPGLSEEITRSERKLQALIDIIDDPATELSAVIRKNVERSEIEAYLKGIRFAMGNGK
jgi:chromosome segregation ATPase